MSPLRRLVTFHRVFFVACQLLPHQGRLEESQSECLARVVRGRREEHHFLLTAWVFLPDHWHAIIFSHYPLSISPVTEAIKVGSTRRINVGRKELCLLWQPRFFGRAPPTVKE